MQTFYEDLTKLSNEGHQLQVTDNFALTANMWVTSSFTLWLVMIVSYLCANCLVKYKNSFNNVSKCGQYFGGILAFSYLFSLVLDVVGFVVFYVVGSTSVSPLIWNLHTSNGVTYVYPVMLNMYIFLMFVFSGTIKWLMMSLLTNK